MKRHEKDEYIQIREYLAKTYFDNKCFVCHKGFRKMKNGSFHHLWYLPNERKYNDYDNKLEYTRQLADHIMDKPSRFLLLCKTHHSAVERLHLFGKDKLHRLLLAERLTQT